MDDFTEISKLLGPYGAVFLVLITKYFKPILSSIKGLSDDSKDRQASGNRDAQRMSRIERRLDGVERENKYLSKAVEAEKATREKELNDIRSILSSVNNSLQRVVGLIFGR